MKLICVHNVLEPPLKDNTVYFVSDEITFPVFENRRTTPELFTWMIDFIALVSLLIYFNFCNFAFRQEVDFNPLK
jgi:hypothetical protein